jgi:hypothetical protein
MQEGRPGRAREHPHIRMHQHARLASPSVAGAEVEQHCLARVHAHSHEHSEDFAHGAQGEAALERLSPDYGGTCFTLQRGKQSNFERGQSRFKVRQVTFFFAFKPCRPLTSVVCILPCSSLQTPLRRALSPVHRAEGGEQKLQRRSAFDFVRRRVLESNERGTHGVCRRQACRQCIV